MRAFVAFLAGMLLFVAFGVTFLTAFDPSHDVTILPFTSIECASPIPAGQPALGGCPAGP
jgi:hypothetical protein